MKKSVLLLFGLFLSVCLMDAKVPEKGFEIKVAGGLSYCLNDPEHDRAGLVDVEFGYKICKFFYVGVQADVCGPIASRISSNPKFILPLSGKVKFLIPNRSKVTPIIDLSYGYSVLTIGRQFKDGRHYRVLEALPGIAWNITDRMHLDFNFGYSRYTPTCGDGLAESNLTGKVGIAWSL